MDHVYSYLSFVEGTSDFLQTSSCFRTSTFVYRLVSMDKNTFQHYIYWSNARCAFHEVRESPYIIDANCRLVFSHGMLFILQQM